MIFLRGKGIIISKKDVEEADRYIDIFGRLWKGFYSYKRY